MEGRSTCKHFHLEAYLQIHMLISLHVFSQTHMYVDKCTYIYYTYIRHLADVWRVRHRGTATLHICGSHKRKQVSVVWYYYAWKHQPKLALLSYRLKIFYKVFNRVLCAHHFVFNILKGHYNKSIHIERESEVPVKSKFYLMDSRTTSTQAFMQNNNKTFL